MNATELYGEECTDCDKLTDAELVSDDVGSNQEDGLPSFLRQ